MNTRHFSFAILLALAPALASAQLIPGLDPSFGNLAGKSGRARAGLDYGGSWRDRAYDLAIDEAGRPVLSGRAEWTTDSYDAAVVRFTSVGQIDSTFGSASNGRVRIAFGGTDDTASSIAIDSQGRHVLAGWSGAFGGDVDFAVSRLDSNGYLDSAGFGLGGVMVRGFDLDGSTGIDRGWDLLLLPTDELVVAGAVQRNDITPSSFHFALARFTTAGTLDTTWGYQNWGGGWEGYWFAGWSNNDGLAEKVLLKRDGTAVLAGRVWTGAAGWSFGLAQDYREFAQELGWPPVETSWTTSTVTIDWDPVDPYVDQATAMALQPDGKILVVGRTETFTKPDLDFAIARLNADGSRDTSFGTNGLVRIGYDLGGANRDEAVDVVLQGDGKILVAGTIDRFNNDRDFLVQRLLPNGAIDPSFGPSGRLIIAFDLGGDLADVVAAMVLAPDGGILVAGTVDGGSGGDTDFAIARLANDYVFADGFEWRDFSPWSAAAP